MIKNNISITNLNPSEKTRWNKLLFDSYNASYRLSLDFCLTQIGFFQNHEIYLFSREDQDIAGTVYTLKSDSSKFFKVAEIRFGILFRSEKELEILPQIIEHFLHWAKINNASYVSFSSYFSKSFNGEITDTHNLANNILSTYGFKPIKDGQHTYLIDLTQSEDEMLYKMNRSTRKLIRRGLKSEIKVEVKESVNQELLNKFWILYSNLAESKNFGYLSKDVFFKRVKGLIENNQALLFITWCSNVIVSITMTSKLGTPAGMYGAISPDFKNIENCISPGPISVWTIFSELKKEGFKTYDMGFCPGRIPDKSHPNYTVWLFKYNFGPDHSQFMPTYGKVLKSLRGNLFQFIKYRN